MQTTMTGAGRSHDAHTHPGATTPTTTTSSWSHERWGGFLLTRQPPNWIHARLTGRLSSRTLRELDRRLLRGLSQRSTHFLVLDATELQHIPVTVAHELAEYDARWRQRGVVAVWVGVNPYLAALLVLACGHEHHLPALPDVDAVRRAIAPVVDRPASVARGWLEAHSDLVH